MNHVSMTGAGGNSAQLECEDIKGSKTNIEHSYTQYLIGPRIRHHKVDAGCFVNNQ